MVSARVGWGLDCILDLTRRIGFDVHAVLVYEPRLSCNFLVLPVIYSSDIQN